VIKFYGPRSDILEKLASGIPEGAHVLEIGPGDVPFLRATHFVDRWFGRTNTTVVDVTNKPLPFADKTFDFVYCRHVVEDLFNPFLLLQEMSRVGKSGYIETPSPMAELCRGIDGASPPYRGYVHHRWIVWVDQDGTLCFVEKANCIEHMDIPGYAVVLANPAAWNTHYCWRDSITWSHKRHDIDFDLHRNYRQLLDMAVVSTLSRMNEPLAIAAGGTK